ncbi:FMN-dependent NADH-azoreductase [Ovoidimarina sediminis]|uniref:FMN-dependent NADH-azoreductase n=1 Tax=Ovoidimarina sediminis TaxID=3079856 RepID=UPI002913234F|nr:NAD(P)H-dependent oxidoreductase [Rhodophyticola sp. MJ-SS7]MDU8944792.1 NAD(P)H-dependent oxidoreductase [Rhodophyticola sp. MJ-SS7]
MSRTLLRIDASARSDGSVSRDLATKIVDRLRPATVIHRDLAAGLPFIDDAWITANFTPAAQRTTEQAEQLALSDTLVSELQAADTIVIGVPVYNFSIPATLKAWIDQIARAGLTFRYTADGPQGLLKGKRAIIAFASGGTVAGSDIDFATGYLRHVLGFIGITDVSVVAADRLALDPEATMANADAQLEALAA